MTGAFPDYSNLNVWKSVCLGWGPCRGGWPLLKTASPKICSRRIYITFQENYICDFCCLRINKQKSEGLRRTKNSPVK